MSERFSREELERAFAHDCRINDEAWREAGGRMLTREQVSMK